MKDDPGAEARRIARRLVTQKIIQFHDATSGSCRRQWRAFLRPLVLRRALLAKRSCRLEESSAQNCRIRQVCAIGFERCWDEQQR
jgi:hypothetical protein